MDSRESKFKKYFMMQIFKAEKTTLESQFLLSGKYLKAKHENCPRLIDFQ